MNKDIKKRLCILAVVCLLILSPVLHVNAEDTGLKVNAEEITLYYLSSEYSNVPIGDEYPTSFQLEVESTGSVKFSVVEGYNLRLSKEGLITPIQAGTAVVQITDGKETKTIRVNVIDYGDIYVEKVISDYLAANITDGMTDYEKIQAIANFPCQYDYGGASSCKGMILSGSGSCWASTNAINILCARVGLESRVRCGYKDEGMSQGTSHRNNIVIDSEGNIYKVEAGYVESAPRKYFIWQQETLQEYEWKMGADGKIEWGLLQNNDNKMTDQYEVRSEYMDRKVTFIADYYSSGSYYNSKKYVLPETITSIGKYAFSGFRLEEINLPDSLVSIEGNSFANCSELKTIHCSDSQPYYKVVNGVIYNKDMTELISAPSAYDLTVPDGVTKIGSWSFRENNNLNTVTLGNSVTEIGTQAFYDCENLSAIYIPETVTSIASSAFYNVEKSRFVIYGKAGSTAESFAAEQGFVFKEKGDSTLTGVVISPDELSVQVGQTKNLTATVTPSGSDEVMCWKSSDPDVVSVSQGKLTAVKKGTATISCYSYVKPSVSATVRVIVTDRVPVEGIEIDQHSLRLVRNQKGRVTVKVLPENAFDTSFTYEVTPLGVASITESNADLYIKGLTVGTAEIRVRSKENGEITDVVTVYVTEPLQDMTLDHEELHLRLGETAKLTPSFVPAENTRQDVVWESYYDDVATVDENGNVTAVGVGTATIYCISESCTASGGTRSATCKIFVGNSVEKIETSESEAWLPVGKIGYVGFNYKVLPEGVSTTKVVWDTDDPEIAEFYEDQAYRVYSDAYLKIDAKKLGDVNIVGTAQDGSGTTVKILLHVITPINGFSLSDQSIEITQGESYTLGYSITPESVLDKTVKWSVNEPEIATVDENGVVTGIRPGTTTIWCAANTLGEEGVSTRTYCSVKVLRKSNPEPEPEPDPEPEPEPGPEPGPEDDPEIDPGADKKDISKLVIIGPEEQTYSGVDLYPAVTVTDGDRTLTEGTDYTLLYSDNHDAGKAQVKICGIGAYEGEADREFLIKKKSIGVSGLKFQDKYYDGSKYMILESTIPTVEGVLPGDELWVTTTRQDYVITGTKSPGEKSRKLTKGLFILSGRDKDNYTLEKGTVAEGKIKKVAVKKVILKATENSYTGRLQKPSIQRIVGNNGARILLKNCSISYERAGNPTSDFTSKGEISVVVSGVGPYKGTVVAKYVIK